MKKFNEEQVMKTQKPFAGYICDGCQLETLDTIQVLICVGADEEGSGEDEYDYCNDCLVQRAPLFVQAGSTAPLVTGVWKEAE